MYHLDGTEYLNQKYYRKTYSVCPECLQKIPAELIEKAGEIWMEKTCPDHGFFKDKISSSAKYYKWTHYGTNEWNFEKNGEANPPDIPCSAGSCLRPGHFLHREISPGRQAAVRHSDRRQPV